MPEHGAYQCVMTQAINVCKAADRFFQRRALCQLPGARAMLATVLFMCTRPPTAMLHLYVLWVIASSRSVVCSKIGDGNYSDNLSPGLP